MMRYWRSLLACVWGIMAAAVFWHGWKPWFPLGTSAHLVLDFIGAAFLAGGAAIRLWASVHVRPCKGKTLATTGPYAYCRHPLYIGSILLILGLCFIAQNTLFDAITLLIWFPAYTYKIRFEERELYKKYGQAWQDYSNKTPRFIPRFSAKVGPTPEANVPHRWSDALVELPGILGFFAIGVLLECLEHYL